jgi:hypothetical protein
VVYGSNLLLRNRATTPSGSPAYGGDEFYGGNGILGQGGKGPIAATTGGGGVSPSQLPPALRNDCPTPAYNPLNPRASAILARRTAEMMEIVESCAFMQLKYPISPMKAQPREGREFQEMHSIPLTDLVDDTNVEVGSFEVPIGMDGNLNRVTFAFIGTGLIEGSGGLLFRVKINSVYARNLGAVPFQYGSLVNAPFIIPGYGIKLVSGQRITFYAFKPAGSPIGGAGARINMGGFGYYWPRK